jgi:hypothetical protein
MIEKTFAAIVLLICLALLARMVLPAKLVHRIDRAGQHVLWRLRYAWNRVRHWRRVRRADAEREAREAIERASRKRTLH